MKVLVVMPAYNAESTLEKTYRDIPSGSVDEVILTDDQSKDNTAQIARRLGITVLEHDQNLGYGGNQKTCYDQGLGQNIGDFHTGFRLGDIPIPTRYFAEASSINFSRSLKYGLLTLAVMGKFLLQKTKLYRFPIFEKKTI